MRKHNWRHNFIVLKVQFISKWSQESGWKWGYMKKQWRHKLFDCRFITGLFKLKIKAGSGLWKKQFIVMHVVESWNEGKQWSWKWDTLQMLKKIDGRKSNNDREVGIALEGAVCCSKSKYNKRRLQLFIRITEETMCFCQHCLVSTNHSSAEHKNKWNVIKIVENWCFGIILYLKTKNVWTLCPHSHYNDLTFCPLSQSEDGELEALSVCPSVHVVNINLCMLWT